MTITNGYATVAQLKKKLGSVPSTSNDTFLEDCITRASRFIDDFTEKLWYSLSLSSEIVDGYMICSENKLCLDASLSRILLPAPAISITSISEDGTVLVANEDYFVYGKSECIDRNGIWSSDRRAISVTGDIGYSSTPAHVEEWCLTISEVLTGLATKTVSDSDGNVTEFIRNSVPKWCFDQMRRHRRVIV